MEAAVASSLWRNASRSLLSVAGLTIAGLGGLLLWMSKVPLTVPHVIRPGLVLEALFYLLAIEAIIGFVLFIHQLWRRYYWLAVKWAVFTLILSSVWYGSFLLIIQLAFTELFFG